jgi:hypothetical protein
MRPALEHGHPVGERDRRGPVGDHERRAAAHHPAERGTDLVLLRRVDRRGRVVEDEHGRVGQDRAGDRDALALAAREREAAFAEHRVVAVGQLRDEVPCAGQPHRALDVLVVGAGPADADVLAHALAEEERFLEDQRDDAPHVVEAKRAQVVAVEQHAAVLGVVEAREQARDGALARAGRADERQGLARRDVQVEPVEHRVVALVAEADGLEANVAAHRALQLLRVPRLPQLRLRLQHLRDPAARAERLLQGRHPLAEHAQRPDEHHDVGVEGDERADGELAADHAAAAEPQHGRDPEQRQHLQHGDEDRVEPRQVECALHDLVASAAEAALERVPGAEALDDPDPADGLLDEGRGLRPRLLQLASARVVAARVEPRAETDERHGDQHDQGKLRVEEQHHDRHCDDRQDVADRVADRVHHPRDVL